MSEKNQTEMYGRRQRFHVVAKTCVYGQDTAQEVLVMMKQACQLGWEPIGNMLIPSGVQGYMATVYFKAECSGAGCSICAAERK